jgi:hypothetical protein
MRTVKEVVEELQWVSDRISTQVRTLGVGLIAITWGLLIAQPQIAGPLPDWIEKHLLIVGILALGAMVCDFMQYICAYWNTKGLLDHMEREGLKEAEYDYASRLYKSRALFFWLKQILIGIAYIWFLAVIIPFCVKVVVSGKGT